MEQIKKIGRYDILYEINSGGMGTVFYGRDEDLERPVAIKMLCTELFKDFDTQLRFIQEAKIVAKLDHPNITKIYSIEYFESNAFLIMEFIKGESLSDIIDKKQQMKVSDVIAILTQLADALSYAHSKGISHLDIKPSNILMDENNKLKLMDFGISHDKDLNLNLPQDEHTGTPRYMSPEQFIGVDIDHRSDIYSFGILAYELLTGHTPFIASNQEEYKKKHLDEKPTLLDHKTVKYPDHIIKFINKCLEKNKTKRPQSLEYFKNEKDNFIIDDKIKNFRYHQMFSKYFIFGLLLFLILVNVFYSVKNIYFKKKKFNTNEIIDNITPPSILEPLIEINNTPLQITESPELQIENLNIIETSTLKKEIILTGNKKNEKPVDTYEKLSFSQIKSIAETTPFESEILDLTINNKNYMKRQSAIQKLLWSPRKNFQSLIPLIKAEDTELVKNISFIFGITNFTESWTHLLERLNFETDIQLKAEIYLSIGYFNVNLFSSMKNHFLNQSFIESSSLIEMENILTGIYGHATEKTVEKVTLMIHMVEDNILKSKLFLFLSSNGNKSFFEWAKKTILEDNEIELKVISLNILSYSNNMTDLDFILNNKRLFFKAVKLMEAYLKTKAILKSKGMFGIQKLKIMEEECEKNEVVLAWLPLYLTTQKDFNDKKCLEDYFIRYSNLKNFKDYILAYNIFKIKFPTD